MPSLQFLSTLIHAYNADSATLLDQYSFFAVECPGLATKSLQSLTFTPAEDGSFWIIADSEGTYWMLPKQGIPINEYSYGSLNKVFNCYGYYTGTSGRFKLRRPVLLAEVDGTTIATFRIEKQGILEFDRATEQEKYVITLECRLSDLEFSNISADPPSEIPSALEARLLEMQSAWDQQLKIRNEELSESLKQQNSSDAILKRLDTIEDTIRRLNENHTALLQLWQHSISTQQAAVQKPLDQTQNLVDNLQAAHSDHPCPSPFSHSSQSSQQAPDPTTPQVTHAKPVLKNKIPLAAHVQRMVQNYNTLRLEKKEFQQLYYFTVVAETSESVTAKQRNREKVIIFAPNFNGSFWAVQNPHEAAIGWLLPRGDIAINQQSYSAISSIFNCRDYREGCKKFEAVIPAKLIIINSNHMELKERGELRFR